MPVQLNTTLVSLELNSNSIDYDGATALAEAISENNSLTSLYLRCRPLLPHVHCGLFRTCSTDSVSQKLASTHGLLLRRSPVQLQMSVSQRAADTGHMGI